MIIAMLLSIRKMRVRLAVVAFMMGAAAMAVDAQVHQTETGQYALRANVVRADTLPNESLQRHGIEAGAGRYLLNVVVVPTGADGRKGVKAAVEVKAQVLAGYDLNVEMKSVAEAGGIAYMGGFSVPPQASAIRFVVTAKPVGGERLTLDFTERLAPRR